jgi:chromosome segregation ATPase
LRLKLEEEYMQNTKNHEEEVQLRLKFESKLNNMHSAHRDLETKFKRTRQDLMKALDEKEHYHGQVSSKNDEITELKTTNTEQSSIITSLKEKVEALQRDLGIKSDQLAEVE